MSAVFHRLKEPNDDTEHTRFRHGRSRTLQRQTAARYFEQTAAGYRSRLPTSDTPYRQPAAATERGRRTPATQPDADSTDGSPPLPAERNQPCGHCHGTADAKPQQQKPAAHNQRSADEQQRDDYSPTVNDGYRLSVAVQCRGCSLVQPAAAY